MCVLVDWWCVVCYRRLTFFSHHFWPINQCHISRRRSNSLTVTNDNDIEAPTADRAPETAAGARDRKWHGSACVCTLWRQKRSEIWRRCLSSILDFNYYFIKFTLFIFRTSAVSQLREGRSPRFKFYFNLLDFNLRRNKTENISKRAFNVTLICSAWSLVDHW